jgi:hypothetical protein
MSSLILCDKSDTTVTTTKTAESALHHVVTNMKIEDRRPSFLNRSPLLLDILDPTANVVGSDTKQKQNVIDQISEAEALIIEDDPTTTIEQQHQATIMTYQEDPTWEEFCEDLPLE